MSLDDLKARARRVADELLTQGDLSIAAELFTADCRHHAPEMIPQGFAGMASWVAALREAFPDLCAIVEDEIAEGETVVLRVTLRGTHHGEYRGIPPTGRRASWVQVEIFRAAADGRFVDRWSCWDRQAVLFQLGVRSDQQGGPR